VSTKPVIVYVPPEPRCPRCGAGFDTSGNCARRQEGPCQGGRGEATDIARRLFEPTRGGGEVPSWVLAPDTVCLGQGPRAAWMPWECLAGIPRLRERWPRALVVHDPYDPEAGAMGRLRWGRVSGFREPEGWAATQFDLVALARHFIEKHSGRLVSIDPVTGADVSNPAMEQVAGSAR